MSRRRFEQVLFEKLEGQNINYGNGKFIEVSRKKCIGADRENIFISLSKGFWASPEVKRYKKNFSVPDDPELLGQVIEALKELKKSKEENL